MAKANNKAGANKNANAGNKKEEKMSKDIVLVKFVRSYTPYVKGEVAGFKNKVADQFIEKGFAEKYKK